LKGEILFWTGLGWYWSASLPLSLLPVAFLPAAFVTLLLTKVSGIPMTEKSRAKRFANDQKYADYVKRTSKLIPGIY
jgi:steroid 5-alpha reductase family enzyme